MNQPTSGARRGLRRILLAGGAGAALVLSGLAAPATAQPGLAPALDPNTPITHDGTVGQAPERAPGVRSALDFAGTGPVGAPRLVPPLAGADPASPLEDTAGVDSIIPPDQRFRVNPTTAFPQTAVVQITRNNFAHCSGWMVGPDTVVTAGHCLHTGGSGGDWFPIGSLRAHPGRNGNVEIVPSCTVNTLFSVIGWTQDGNEQFDYGAMVLNCTVGFQTGWFGFTTSQVMNRTCGYPGDKPLGQQWCSNGPVTALTANQTFYQNDTIGGQSGSAVYHTNHPIGCGACAIAIHGYGLHGGAPHGNNNHGARITPPRFDNIVLWRGF